MNLIRFTDLGSEIADPDQFKGEAAESRSDASGFLCETEADQAYGVKVIQGIKKARRLWKEHNQESIDASQDSVDSSKRALAVVKGAWSRIDDELDAAEEVYRAKIEAWIDRRRETQKAHLISVSQALEQTPVQIADHLSSAFDVAIADGDTAKAERILQQASVPSMAMVLDFPMIDAAVLNVPETMVPKLPGASAVLSYTWELLEESKLPREFMTADRKKITKLVKAMGADAQRLLGSGVLVRPDTTLRIREK